MSSSQPIDASKLGRAAHSLRLIRDRLAEADGGRVDAPLREGLGRLEKALERCQECLQPLLERAGIISDVVAARTVPQAGDAEAALLAEEVERSAVFVERAGDWLCSRTDPDVEDVARMVLSGLAHYVTEAHTATRSLLGLAVATPPAADRRAGSVEAEAAETVEASPDTELVLMDSAEEPLLQEWQGNLELTPRAKELVAGFLEQAGLDYSEAKIKRLCRKVERWLQATPDGMTLVLRISGLKGRLEPYPKYQPSVLVAGA